MIIKQLSPIKYCDNRYAPFAKDKNRHIIIILKEVVANSYSNNVNLFMTKQVSSNDKLVKAVINRFNRKTDGIPLEN